MSNDDSTRGSGGGFRDRDRLPPYAPTPAGWVLPEDTGALELPTTDGANQSANSTQPADSQVADPTQPTPGDPVIPDPAEPTPAESAPAESAPAEFGSEGYTEPGYPQSDYTAEPPAGDLDTDAVIPADLAELPTPEEVIDSEEPGAEQGLAWGEVPTSGQQDVAPVQDAGPEVEHLNAGPEQPDDAATTVLPAVVSVQPGDVTRTQAIAGLTGTGAASGPAASATDGTTESPDDIPVASASDAAASEEALAGTSKVPSRVDQNRGKDPIRTIARGIGQTLITLGVVVLLFVVYEVYVTDLFGEQKQEKVQAALDEKWAQKSESIPSGSAEESAAPSVEPPAPAAQVVDPAERVRNYDTAIGEGFAKIFIPALGSDYEYTIVEGTTVEDLYGSPGHYEDTQYPGELGNFAVAGHRVSKGSPFNALGTLSSCDSIIIETQDDWFVYRLLPMEDEIANWNSGSRVECTDVKPLDGEYAGLPGREITLPSDYAQVLPVPRVNAAGPEALAAATQRIITLTTCHPQFSDAERMIVHGVLVKSYAKADGFVPPELNEV